MNREAVGRHVEIRVKARAVYYTEKNIKLRARMLICLKKIGYILSKIL